jgi:ATP-dependent Clp protease ATP-binding subunit ClpC
MLDKPALRQVIDLEFNKLVKRLTKKHISVTLDDGAKDFLVEKGYVPEMGARPLRRMIEQYIEDPLAEKLLQNPLAEKSYLISVKDGAVIFIENTPPAPPAVEEKSTEEVTS